MCALRQASIMACRSSVPFPCSWHPLEDPDLCRLLLDAASGCAVGSARHDRLQLAAGLPSVRSGVGGVNRLGFGGGWRGTTPDRAGHRAEVIQAFRHQNATRSQSTRSRSGARMAPGASVRPHTPRIASLRGRWQGIREVGRRTARRLTSSWWRRTARGLGTSGPTYAETATPWPPAGAGVRVCARGGGLSGRVAPLAAPPPGLRGRRVVRLGHTPSSSGRQLGLGSRPPSPTPGRCPWLADEALVGGFAARIRTATGSSGSRARRSPVPGPGGRAGRVGS